MYAPLAAALEIGAWRAALPGVSQDGRLRNPVIALDTFFERMQDVRCIVEIRSIQAGNLIESVDAEFLELCDEFWTDATNL